MKISTFIKALPILFIIMLLSITLVFKMTYESVNDERTVTVNQQNAISLSTDFQNIVNYILNQSQSYIKYGDKYYFDVYEEEVNIFKTRESYMTQLKSMNLHQNEITLLDEAFKNSNDIITLNKSAFDFISKKKQSSAESIITSADYKQKSANISKEINDFQNSINFRTKTELNNNKIGSSKYFILNMAVIVLTIILIIWIFILLNKKIKSLDEMIKIAAKITKGNFDVSLEQYFSKDEFGLLATELGDLTAIIRSLILDIEHLTEQHDLGNINVTIDNQKYNGAYQKVSIGLTNMVGSYVIMINEISSALTEFANGNFTIPLKQYSGEKSAINVATEELRSNLANIKTEINNLVDASSLGILSERANIDSFKGDWATICLGLNHLLETIFEKLINSAPMAYILVKKSIVIEANDYAIKNLGIELNSKINLLYAIIEDRQRLINILKRDGIVENEIVKFVVNDNIIRRYNINVSQIKSEDNYCTIFWIFDVEEEQQKKDAIQRAQLDLKKLIDALPMPLHIVDASSKKIVYGNTSYFDLFEFDNDDQIIGSDVHQLFDNFQSSGEESNAMYGTYENKILSTSETVSWIFEYTTKSQKVIEAKVTGGEIVYNNNLSLIEIIQDISVEKKQTKLLEQAIEKEHEANEIKDRFLVNMSHEIRTPMNAIIGLSQLALMKEQTRENEDVFEKINTSSKNLLIIINDILDFSKIQADKIDFNNEEFVLEEVISNAFMVASELISNKHIEMLLYMDADVPINLFGDKTRLWQVLKNLLDNAAKYTQEGRIVLKVETVSAKDIPIYDEKNMYIKFVVEDSGLGMTEKQLSMLFNPFEQFHNKSKFVSSGTGLGMSISKQLIELMGGTIDVESKENIGTKFTVTIGFQNILSTSSIIDAIDCSSISGSNILIIDDDLLAIEIMNNLLTIAGANVVSATNRKDAIAHVLHHEKIGNPFKIIILDYILGDDNGVLVAKKLNELASTNYKLLMVSAYSKSLLSSQIEDVGFDGIIEKPFVPTNFIQHINNSLCSKEYKEKKSYVKFKNAKVLVCEDNLINQDVIKRILEVFGINATIVNNGEEAIPLLENDFYHLILMDIFMPILDGYSTTKIIRASGKHYKDIPIIALTANAMKTEYDKCISCGMNEHISKPIDFDLILEKLVKYLPHFTQDNELSLTFDHSINIAIDGADLNEGLSRFCMDTEKYFSTLRSFATDTNYSLPRYSTAILPENIDTTKRAIHSLKGVSGNLGITSIFELCKALESSIENGEIYGEIYFKINETYNTVSSNILKQIPTQTVKTNMDVGTMEELFIILTELEKYLNDFELDKIDELIISLKYKSWSIANMSKLNNLYSLIDYYKFEEASLLVKNYHEELAINEQK